jgi:hypothetical protein
MPVKPKPPSKGSGTVDIAGPGRPSADAGHSRGDTTLHFTPDPFAVKTAGNTPEPGRVTSEFEVATSPPRVNLQATRPTSGAASSAEHNPLQPYLIPAAPALPDADAQGIRTHKGRQYVDVQGGGTVLIAIDPQTGLHRAKLSSELQGSGPLLARDPVNQRWYPLEDFAATGIARKGSSPQRQSGDDYDSALEDLSSTADSLPEQFYLASESMPIKPFSADELKHMRLAQPYSFRDNQLGTYNRVNNGKYPLRDTAGRPIRIRKLQNWVALENGDKYTSEQIKPYIKFEGYEDVARLYEEKLQLRKFTEADVRVVGEKGLIGQYMVVANRRISKGEAVGVYGGVLTPLRFISRSEQTFTMSAGAHMRFGGGNFTPDPIIVVGDNILSRINTHFIYDATGKPISQAADGYNVIVVAFKVEADMPLGIRTAKRPYTLNALFASSDIPAGTELRWNYNYSDEEISWIFP